MYMIYSMYNNLSLPPPSLLISNYPTKRVEKDADGLEYGVLGSLELLNQATVAEQPVSAFAWSPDKMGLCAFVGFDQALRVGVVTKLNLY